MGTPTTFIPNSSNYKQCTASASFPSPRFSQLILDLESFIVTETMGLNNSLSNAIHIQPAKSSPIFWSFEIDKCILSTCHSSNSLPSSPSRSQWNWKFGKLLSTFHFVLLVNFYYIPIWNQSNVKTSFKWFSLHFFNCGFPSLPCFVSAWCDGKIE